MTALTFSTCYGQLDGMSPGDLIPLDKPSATLTSATNAVESTLGAFKPLKKGTKTFVTDDKRMILYGELFQNGENYALMQVNTSIGGMYPDDYYGSVAFVRWTDGKWALCQLWNIESEWRPKGWEPEQGNDNKVAPDWLPIDHPAERAFELQDLGGPVPDVIIAGECAKYYQSFYIFRFDPKTNTLLLADNAMAKPEYRDGYVRLYYKSPHRAIFEEWDFCKWEGLKLVQRASWHEETPYNNIDSSFIDASRTDQTGKLHTYHAVDEADSADGLSSTYTISASSGKIAKIIFIQRKDATSSIGGYDAQQHYLFERLTGLPTSLYPDTLQDIGTVEPMEIRNIRVTGDPELVKLLSLNH